MRFMKTSAAVLALLVATTVATPALAAPQFSIGQLDANLVAAAKLLKHVRDNRMATQEDYGKAARLLVWLIEQRNHVAKGEARLGEWIEAYRKAVQVYNGTVRKYQSVRSRLTAEQDAQARALIAKMGARIANAKSHIEKGADLRAKAYEQLLPLSEALVKGLRAFIANRTNPTTA